MRFPRLGARRLFDAPTVRVQTEHLRMVQESDMAVRWRYLQRIGFAPAAITALVARPPNLQDLTAILCAHAETVPFENLDQHAHPAGSSSTAVYPEVARRTVPATLDVHVTLAKLVGRRRGGFCFEINLALAWLLRALGYTVHLTLCDIRCRGTTPFTHVACIVDGACLSAPPQQQEQQEEHKHQNPLVDDGLAASPKPQNCGDCAALGPSGDLISAPGHPLDYLVDLGIGEPFRAAVPLISSRQREAQAGDFAAAATAAATTTTTTYATDAQGIRYMAVGTQGTVHAHARFDTVLLRARPVEEFATPGLLGFSPDAATAVAPASDGAAGADVYGDYGAVYRFNSGDDLAYAAVELQAGLDCVLADPLSFFTQKRICTRGTPEGHVTLCTDRIQWTERGMVVKVTPLPTNVDWREALMTEFGILLWLMIDGGQFMAEAVQPVGSELWHLSGKILAERMRY